MLKPLATCAAAVALLVSFPAQSKAQEEILSEMYGRGVHAYYSSNYSTAYQYLSSAIGGGFEDPLAYYFRGIVAYKSGRQFEAEADWQSGARLEAEGRVSGSIGRALSRVQGSLRLKLEEIRQQTRLQVLASKAARSKARYGEINAGAAPAVRSATPAPAVAPPTAVANDNPFADDLAAEPEVAANDALESAMTPPPSNPFEDDPAPAAGDAPAGGDVFGGDDATDDDPFGSSAPADDPFGGDMEDDPFGI